MILHHPAYQPTYSTIQPTTPKTLPWGRNSSSKWGIQDPHTFNFDSDIFACATALLKCYNSLAEKALQEIWWLLSLEPKLTKDFLTLLYQCLATRKSFPSNVLLFLLSSLFPLRTITEQQFYFLEIGISLLPHSPCCRMISRTHPNIFHIFVSLQVQLS